MSTKILESADGRLIALHELGGGGDPLLLTHGNGLNAGMWAGVTPLLSDRFHCFGLDFRGHGAAGSDDLTLDVARDRYAEDLFTAIAEIGHGPILTAGHSLGAVATIMLELRRPGSIAAAWLYEPVLIPDDFALPPAAAADALIEASRRRRNSFESIDDAEERFRSKPPFDRCDPAAVRAYAELGTMPDPNGGLRLSCHPENEARVFESGVPQDLSTYAAITTPITVARGGTASQGDVPATVAPLLVAALGDADLVTFDQLSHFGPMEDPPAVAASILERLGAGHRPGSG